MTGWDWFVAYWLLVLTVQSVVNYRLAREKNHDH